MELAYRLAVSEQPFIKAIRSSVVVLINPVSEPDGRDRFVDWYYRYLKGKTDYDTLPPLSPPYWGRYVFHDNNRDAHQRALETTARCSGSSMSTTRWRSTTCTSPSRCSRPGTAPGPGTSISTPSSSASSSTCRSPRCAT